ncbi:recombinase family protein [Kocuria sp. KH4]
MGKIIGYVQVSTRQPEANRQANDLLGAGVRRDDVYVNYGVSEGRVFRSAFDKAVAALGEGGTLVITMLDRLGRSTQNMLAFVEALPGLGAGLRVLNLGGRDVDTATSMGSMVFTVRAAMAQVELVIKRERITDSVARRRAAGKDLDGLRQTFTDSQIRNALRLIESEEPATQVARDLGMSRATLYRRIRELPHEMII